MPEPLPRTLGQLASMLLTTMAGPGAVLLLLLTALPSGPSTHDEQVLEPVSPVEDLRSLDPDSPPPNAMPPLFTTRLRGLATRLSTLIAVACMIFILATLIVIGWGFAVGVLPRH